jgi:hypothetical protein
MNTEKHKTGIVVLMFAALLASSCADEADLSTANDETSSLDEGNDGSTDGAFRTSDNSGACEAPFTGPQCDECADSKFTGADCTECVDPTYTGANCDVCAATLSYQACSDNAVHWFNDCDQPVALVEECIGEAVCVEGACTTDCQPQVSQSYQACSGNAVYWFNDCHQPAALVEDCIGDMVCDDGECKMDCQAEAGKYCLNNAITWYDSCDQPGLVVQDCGASQICEGCSIAEKPCTTTPVCTAASIDFDPTGSWWLVADAPYQENCAGSGGKTFEEHTLELTVTGSDAAGVTEPPELFITLDFEGTLMGSKLTMAAPNTELGPPSQGWAIEHVHTIDVNIASETSFAGTYVWEAVPNDATPCTYTWTITGTKQ